MEVFEKFGNYFKQKDSVPRDLHYENNITIEKKEDYRIKISQDGKFVATFDIANLLIKVLHNTGSVEIDKPVAYFKINDNFIVEKLYDPRSTPAFLDRNKNKPDDLFRWSYDVSNMYKNNGQLFVFVTMSRINFDDDMKEGNKPDDDMKEGSKPDYKREKLRKHEYNIQPRTKSDDISKQNDDNELQNDVHLDIDNESQNDENKGKDDENKEKNDENEKEKNEKNKKGIAIYRIELNEDKENGEYENGEYENGEYENGKYENGEYEKEEKENEEEEKGNAEEEKGNEKNYSLKAVTCYYSYNISGICRFIEDSSEEKEDEKGSKGKEKGKEDNVPKAEEADVDKSRDKDNKLKRFIVLNTHGIYNFKFSDNYDSFKMDEKFEYPESLKYIESFEVYNFEKMELVTTAKRIRKEDELYNFVKKHDYNIFNRFTIGKLHFCFTQGNNTIKLYCMENGLQVVSKKFYEIEKIHLLEFIDCDKKLLIIGSLKNEEKIIDKNQNSEKNEKKCKFKFIVWDLYKTERPIIDDFIYLPIITNADIVKHLASTSGNVLQIDDDGKVLSVVKKVEEMLKQKKQEDKKKKVKIYSVEPIVSISEMEPWVLDENDESSNKCYNLYQNDKEAETLQLIVGRSTVQIWHQIKNEDNPNKGEPFLEFIWTNHIPVYQEKKATKLQIKKFEMYECESNNKSNIKIKDFYLEVCWYKRNKECSNTIKTEQNINHIIEEEDNEIDKIENKKYKKHACKALEHFNKRYINKDFVDNYIRVRNYEEMITYIKHIVWKFVKYEPQNFKLLDVRYNIMKNLILGDCDNLIKFILFGDDKIYKNKNKEIGHIPSNKLWPGKKFLKDDDLNFDKRKNESKDISNELQNNMELAIYHYKGKDTTIVACLLEYYSNHAMDDAGWMCTVSKAIPLLFEYNYDDYIKKLFLKECFAGHTHNSVEISVNFLTFIKSRISNFLTSHNNEFRSFEIDKLKTEFFKNKKSKLIESPLLRIVPLPNFIINNIKEKKEMIFLKKG
ncbi:hypothetical protein RhiirA1_455334 [Rhizophagus irregularis]|uniref:Uncharacterized protein n=1 Tax=Rhizophagus irregularis TaxID=588596 RepID=A0A2N0S363_9GLOM|nr:hypothetical protein RhiirA1_455334 [Rhizophagus irregularis]